MSLQPSPQADQPTPQSDKAAQFLALHTPGSPLLMPNAWDIGSAKLFEALNIKAIATTSGGFAASRGRLDGAMSKHEVLAHSQELATAVDLPVSADLENCFAHDPEGVAATIDEAIATGLAGGSVEDFTGKTNDERGDYADQPIYELAQAADRVRAAAEAAHRGPVHFVLTARAENYLHGRTDLADTIKRLQAFQEAGRRCALRAGRRRPQGTRATHQGRRHPGQRADAAQRPRCQWAGRARRGSHLRRRGGGRCRLRCRHQGDHRASGAGHRELLGAHEERPLNYLGGVHPLAAASDASASRAPVR